MIHIQSQSKIIKITVAILLIIIVAFLYINYRDYYKIKDRRKQVQKFRSVDNKKAIGWLRVQGTNIDMPIVYFYENDVQDPTNNIGWDFQNHKKQKQRMIIHSHNMRNLSSQPLIAKKGHERFEQLMSFIYTSFVNKNKYIQYTINGKNHLYKIYGISLQKENEMNNYETNAPKEYAKKYIEEVKKNSFFDMNVDVKESDKLLTLVTCTRFYGNSKFSFVIDAREVRKNEKIKNYKIKENKNYKKVKKILEGDVKK